ncbi:hypothetical protein MRX96_057613 [Rhipicephalus microplus]
MLARAAREERHGPVFIRAPPSRVEFLNSTQTVVPCDVQSVPRPEVWWWRVGSQGPAPDIPGLRHVRVQDGALVFSPFRAEDFRQDIHAAVYRCGARNSVGSIVSGDVHVRVGIVHVATARPIAFMGFVFREATAALGRAVLLPAMRLCLRLLLWSDGKRMPPDGKMMETSSWEPVA